MFHVEQAPAATRSPVLDNKILARGRQ